MGKIGQRDNPSAVSADILILWNSQHSSSDYGLKGKGQGADACKLRPRRQIVVSEVSVPLDLDDTK
jgi:hypothetical protein